MIETQNLNWQLSISYSELLVISHPKNMVWKGIFGVPGFDQNTVRDSGKTQNFFGGKRDLIATREAGFTTI